MWPGAWSATFFTTFWLNVSLSWDGIVKNIEPILLNLAAGEMEWYVMVGGYTATIGGKNTMVGQPYVQCLQNCPRLYCCIRGLCHYIIGPQSSWAFTVFWTGHYCPLELGLLLGQEPLVDIDGNAVSTLYC